MVRTEKNMDYQVMMYRTFMKIMIFMIVMMFTGFIFLIFLQNQYNIQAIDKETYLRNFQYIGIIIMLCMSLPFLYMGAAAIKFKFDRLRFEKDQGRLDTFQGPIEFDPHRKWEYQIQTPPTKSGQMRVTDRMITRLQKTVAFETLKRRNETGSGIVNVNQSNLFQQMIQDIKELRKDQKLASDIKKALIKKESDQAITNVEFVEPKSPFLNVDEEEDLKEEETENEIEDDEYTDKDEEEDRQDEEEESKIDSMEEDDDSDADDTKDETLVEDSDSNEDLDPDRDMTPIEEEQIDPNAPNTIERGLTVIRDGLINTKANIKAKIAKWRRIRTGNVKSPMTIKVNYDVLLKAGYLAKCFESKWQIGFRYVTDFKCLDRDEEEPETVYDENLKREIYKDPILNSEAIAYLIPDRESNVFKPFDRRSGDENKVMVRKYYTSWKFVGWLIDNRVPLLLSTTSVIGDKVYNLQLSGETFADAETIASTQLVYISYNAAEADKKKIQSLEADLNAKEYQLSEIRNQKIEKWLEQNNLIPTIKSRVEFRAMNATAIVFSIVIGIMGVLFGRMLG